MRRPRVVIAGTHSGSGKTSISVALVAALRRRGLRVQTFKVGPDYLDPTHLAAASGRPCMNLDTWMTGVEYVRQLFLSASANADVSIVEGVMGLFDGADPDRLDGSTAEVAMALDAPVLLVVDAHGAARSMAAVVEGFARFESRLRVVGVLANRVGSTGHAALLEAALRGRSLPPLVGAIPHDAFPKLPGRHLGLLPANECAVTPALLDKFAEAIERGVDLSRVMSIARDCPDVDGTGQESPSPAGRCVRLGVARDEAFFFYYPDNLEALERAGCELVPFSPLSDPQLPEGLHGLYLGGGYPEIHAEALSANRSMLDAIRRFVQGGSPLYAECGGLMYLAQSIETLTGDSYPLAGLLPCSARMLEKRKALGYAEITCTAPSLWGGPGTTLRGHEFHYSELTADPTRSAPWACVYAVRGRHRARTRVEGYQRGRVLASYIHAHFASRPAVVAQFVSACRPLEPGVSLCKSH